MTILNENALNKMIEIKTIYYLFAKIILLKNFEKKLFFSLESTSMKRTTILYSHLG
ncbi:MAG: hypothetical protein ACI976_001206 [Aureispira sp.]|jgi:hypothetical protein